MDKIGFCADYQKQPYKCANCGHKDIISVLTNFYDHKTIEWKDKTCPECGFKSYKPYDDWLPTLIQEQTNE